MLKLHSTIATQVGPGTAVGPSRHQTARPRPSHHLTRWWRRTQESRLGIRNAGPCVAPEVSRPNSCPIHTGVGARGGHGIGAGRGRCSSRARRPPGRRGGRARRSGGPLDRDHHHIGGEPGAVVEGHGGDPAVLPGHAGDTAPRMQPDPVVPVQVRDQRAHPGADLPGQRGGLGVDEGDVQAEAPRGGGDLAAQEACAEPGSPAGGPGSDVMNMPGRGGSSGASAGVESPVCSRRRLAPNRGSASTARASAYRLTSQPFAPSGKVAGVTGASSRSVRYPSGGLNGQVRPMGWVLVVGCVLVIGRSFLRSVKDVRGVTGRRSGQRRASQRCVLTERR